MHVLYNHMYFCVPTGSTGIRSYMMARRLIERGHQVTMVTGTYALGSTGLTGPFRRRRREGTYEGIRVIEYDTSYSNHDGIAVRAKNFAQYGALSIADALRTDYDLVFATTTPLTAAIPGLAGTTLRRRPFVFEVRDLWPELPKEMGVLRDGPTYRALLALEWAAYNSATACIGLSPGIADGIKKKLRRNVPVAMVPNGCDLDIFKPSVSPEDVTPIPGVEEGDFVAVFTGAHGQANGLDAVLDTAATLKARGRSDIRLVFIGDGKFKPALKARASEEQLTNCVFVDPVPKPTLASMLRGANAGLMILANIPGFYYGTSPNKFFDYIAAGLPVLNNYPGWLADMIQTEQCGLVSQPGHADELADNLMQLADNPDTAVAMGARARQLAEREFARSDLADQWVDVLEQAYTKHYGRTP